MDNCANDTTHHMKWNNLVQSYSNNKFGFIVIYINLVYNEKSITLF